MTDQNTFIETLDSVKEIMRVAEAPMSEQEILQYFSDMELSPEHKQMVLAYLQEVQKEGEESYSGTEDLPEDSRISDRKTGNSGKRTATTGSEDSKVFRMYLEEIASLPVYSQEEEEALYERLLEGDTEVVYPISNLWLVRVLEVAKKYREPKLRIEDLVQEGNMALLVKLQELVGSKADVEVRKLLEQEIEAGIMAYVAESRGEWEMENAIVGKISLVHEAKKLLTEDLGREPDLKELADYTKIPVGELSDLEDFMKETGDNI